MTSKQSKDNKYFIYGTIIVLAVVFVALIGLVFLFSGPLSSLGWKCIAVVNIDQELMVESAPSSLFSSGYPGSEEMAQNIAALNDRDDVGAVVFVMNSPGGSVVATREIYDSVKSLEKPKVAYFREVSASGSYYVSTATDYIISDPNAVTGSIGVIATFSDMSGLFDKIGINSTPIKSGAHKDIGSSSRPMTDEERHILDNIVQEVFQEFKDVVLQNRGTRLNKELFNEVLDGRIVSGRQAKQIGLVDALGTKKDAIKKAAALAKITEEKPAICEVNIMGEQDSGLFGVNSLFGTGNRRLKLSYE